MGCLQSTILSFDTRVKIYRPESQSFIFKWKQRPPLYLSPPHSPPFSVGSISLAAEDITPTNIDLGDRGEHLTDYSRNVQTFLSRIVASPIIVCWSRYKVIKSNHPCYPRWTIIALTVSSWFHRLCANCGSTRWAWDLLASPIIVGLLAASLGHYEQRCCRARCFVIPATKDKTICYLSKHLIGQNEWGVNFSTNHQRHC